MSCRHMIDARLGWQQHGAGAQQGLRPCSAPFSDHKIRARSERVHEHPLVESVTLSVTSFGAQEAQASRWLAAARASDPRQEPYQMRQQRWRAGNSPPDTTVTAGSWCRVVSYRVARKLAIFLRQEAVNSQVDYR